MRPSRHVELLKAPLRGSLARPTVTTRTPNPAAWQCLRCRYSFLAARGQPYNLPSRRNGPRNPTSILSSRTSALYTPARTFFASPLTGKTEEKKPGPSEKEHVTQIEEYYKRRANLPKGSYPENIAIVGGGISGLAAAHFVGKEFPKSKITLFEKGKEVGGWVKSVHVPLKTENGEEEVLFEYGPRTLRPGANAIATLQLIKDLGLEDDVLTISNASPAAENRFMYYPDRLNKLPSPGKGPLNLIWEGISLLRTGLLDGMWRIVSEPGVPKRPASLTDESVGDFFSRRVDRRPVDRLLSAVLHGIYAGDAYQLSAKSILPGAWHGEGEHGSMLHALLLSQQDPTKTFQSVGDNAVLKQMFQETDVSPELSEKLSARNISTFTFKDGMQQLVHHLEDRLRENPNLEILTETSVTEYKKVSAEKETKIELSATSTGGSGMSVNKAFDFVICASAPPVPQSEPLAPPVTVQTVNLFYKTPNLVPVRGFGYLIPQAVPFAQNPERALGVIFDHDATPAFNPSSPAQSQDSIPGTKLTVMLGGHWWDGWTSYPSDAEAKKMAMDVVSRHLGIKHEPDACHVNLSQNCIPQYTVGYSERLSSLAHSLIRQFSGRVRVLGAPYSGVGLNDCLRAAWETALNMRGETTNWKSTDTAGLPKVEKSDMGRWKMLPRLTGTALQRARAKDAQYEWERKMKEAREDLDRQMKELRGAYEKSREKTRREDEKIRRDLERRNRRK